MRRRFLTLLAAAAACALAGVAVAQTFPTRPVTMVVPFTAGGPTDTLVRIVAERMSRALGQNVIVENQPGAAGTIAAQHVARSAPDGYTIDVATWSTHIVSPVIYHTQYDVFRDFEPVALMTETPLMLLGRKDLPANNLKELIGWLKSRSQPALQGGAGGTDQVAGYLFEKETGTRLQFVPYRGYSLAIQDLLGGRIDILFDQPSDAVQRIKTGDLKVYAVTAKDRLAIAPNVPTVDEVGVPSIHMTPWHALWVPKGTPAAIVARLNAATVETLADPIVRQRLADIGQSVVPRDRQTPEALAAFYKAETDKWWPLIKAAGIKPE